MEPQVVARQHRRKSGGLWEVIARQLHHPEGRLGTVAGKLMAAVNKAPNEAALAALQVQAHHRVLELGFGPGEALKVMYERTPEARIWGIDQSEAMIRRAACRNGQAIASGHVRLLKGSFSSLPFPAATFDRLLAVNVAYFFGEDGLELAEARRVLRPGGRLVIYVTARSTMESWPFAASGSHRLFDFQELRTSLTDAGFPEPHVRIKQLPLSFGVRGLLAIADHLC